MKISDSQKIIWAYILLWPPKRLLISAGNLLCKRRARKFLSGRRDERDRTERVSVQDPVFPPARTNGGYRKKVVVGFYQWNPEPLILTFEIRAEESLQIPH